ncbi:restriction endonuclease subunit S [Ligilactobacillus salivarius]|uniref:restriction endonuclease subunit S n=1 Tax=Ligilactobacillus salivarius TaxID=1624 RepID=UPI0018875D17|nr:restriction endonuclease subunit S [Ligilactobacillus salivarius]
MQFEFPNEEGKPYKSSGGKMVWNKELQQEIPDGWASSKLKNIIVENPKSKIKVSDVKNDGEIPFFTSGTDILSTSESIVSGLNCYLNTGGNADVKYYYGEASYSTDTWCITAENETKYILPFVLNKIKPSMDKVFFQGTGLHHLQKNLLREYQFCLPDSNVVKEFSKLASDIFKKQHYLLEENKKLESLKQFLLPLLMNGQVTINEK